MTSRIIILLLTFKSILLWGNSFEILDSTRNNFSFSIYFLAQERSNKTKPKRIAELASLSIEGLRGETSSEDPVTRCRAFMILAEKHDSATFGILLKHLSDDEIVRHKGGCVIGDSYVGDIFVNSVKALTSYKLSNNQEVILDSALIHFNDIKLSAKDRLLKTIKPNQNYYNRIRDIVLKEKNSTALIPLSRFKKEQDIQIIKQHLKRKNDLYNAIYAAREFPSTILKLELIRVFERKWKEKYYSYSEWRVLYQALIQYDDMEIHKLFERTLSTEDKFKYQTLSSYFMIAITKYPFNNYSRIKESITLEPYYLDKINNELDWD